MPATAIACPSCRAPLRVPTPVPSGRPVKCPHCARTFALSPALAAANPAVPVYQVNCPKCAAPLRSSKPVPPGRLSKCPKCAHVFRAPGKIEAAALRPSAPPPQASRPTPAKPPAAAAPQYTWAKCPKCRSVLRVPGIIPPGKPVKCGPCHMVFLIPPRQTRLQPPGTARTTTLAPAGATPPPAPAPPAPAPLPVPATPTAPAPPKRSAASAVPRPVLRLDCPGCKTALKLTGNLPIGKVLLCPRCRRPVRLNSRKPAAKTRLAVNRPRKTQLARGPVRKTQLTAAAARPTQLATPPAAAPTPRTATAPPAPLAAKPPAAPNWLRPLRYALSAAVFVAVIALGVVGAGFFGLGPLGGPRDIPAAEFQEFAPPGGRCRVVLPGTPTPLRAGPRSVGGAGAQQFVLVRQEDDIAFRLSYWDRPAGARTSFRDVAGMVESHLRDEVDGIVVQRQDISLDGRPGKEWIIEPAGGGTLRVRCYEARGTTADRFYVLLVGMGRPRLHAASAARFLDSFAIDAR